MNILFLDDQDIRHDLAEKILSSAGHSVLHAFDCLEAIDILMAFAKPIGLGMLDHDLQDIIEEQDGRKIERHGVYFVDQMIETVPREKWFGRAIVHSYNPNGAKYMRDKLIRNGVYSVMDSFSGDMLRRAVAELSIQ